MTHVFACGSHHDVLQLDQTFVDPVPSPLFCDWFVGLYRNKKKSSLFFQYTVYFIYIFKIKVCLVSMKRQSG